MSSRPSGHGQWTADEWGEQWPHGVGRRLQTAVMTSNHKVHIHRTALCEMEDMTISFHEDTLRLQLIHSPGFAYHPFDLPFSFLPYVQLFISGHGPIIIPVPLCEVLQPCTFGSGGMAFDGFGGRGEVFERWRDRQEIHTASISMTSRFESGVVGKGSIWRRRSGRKTYI